MREPAEQIERFLRDNPSGPLLVTVGYASAYGLGWLNERTAGRPVKLLIGDTRKGFSKYKERDRLAAIEFIQRQDVSVLNWYRKKGGQRTAHAKAWLVEPDLHAGISGAVLVGSANLSKRGLHRNFEMLSLADRRENERLRHDMRQVMDESWNTEDRLLQQLGNAAELQHRRGPSPKSPSPRQPRRAPKAFRRKTLVNVAAICFIGLALVFTVRMIDVLPGPSSEFNDGPSPSANISAPTLAQQAAERPAPEAIPESDLARTAMPEQPAPNEVLVGEPPNTAMPEQPAPLATLPASNAPATLQEQPNIETIAPPGDWDPVVDGNASSYGEPKRSDLQWVAWQPNCPTCEAGATLTWVGSHAFSYNQFAGNINEFRPLLRSACLHRKRTGPQIDWKRDVSNDQVVAMWVDGESVPPGLWWIGNRDRGENSHLMVPEPEPFLALLADAKDIRVLTSKGLDATFSVDGFLTTPVQANLDYCGHYP